MAKTAAERYDEAMNRCVASWGSRPDNALAYRTVALAAIEAAVAEERARCAAVARSTHWRENERQWGEIIARAIERDDAP